MHSFQRPCSSLEHGTYGKQSAAAEGLVWQMAVWHLSRKSGQGIQTGQCRSTLLRTQSSWYLVTAAGCVPSPHTSRSWCPRIRLAKMPREKKGSLCITLASPKVLHLPQRKTLTKNQGQCDGVAPPSGAQRSWSLHPAPPSGRGGHAVGLAPGHP